MEPIEPNILGMILGGLASVAEPHATAIELLADAPAQHRPLRMASAGRLIDVHPSQITDLARTFDPAGQAALEIGFGPEVSDWLAVTTGLAIGQPMQIQVCPQVLAAPVIHEAIHGGRVTVSGAADLAQDDTMLRIIAGQIACDGTPLTDAASAPERRRPGGRP